MTEKTDSVLRAGRVVDKFIADDVELGRIHVIALASESHDLGEHYLGKTVAGTVSYQEVDPVRFSSAELGQPWPDEATARAAAVAAQRNQPLLQRICKNSLPQQIPGDLAIYAAILPLTVLLTLLLTHLMNGAF